MLFLTVVMAKCRISDFTPKVEESKIAKKSEDLEIEDCVIEVNKLTEPDHADAMPMAIPIESHRNTQPQIGPLLDDDDKKSNPLTPELHGKPENWHSVGAKKYKGSVVHTF